MPREASATRVGRSKVFVYQGYIWIMEKNMETPVVTWGYIGIMEKNREATIL